MTNGEAIKWIINISADIGKAEHRDLWHYEQALSEIRDMLESAQPEPKWIPCSERMPEPQTEVMVSFDNGEVKILWQNWADPSSLSNYPGEPLAYIGGDGIPHTYEEWESMKTYAVAWMPLPEPYAERRTDEAG